MNNDRQIELKYRLAMLKTVSQIAKWTMGIFMVFFLHLIALVYDGQWIYVAVGVDLTGIGVFLGIGFNPSGNRKL